MYWRMYVCITMFHWVNEHVWATFYWHLKAKYIGKISWVKCCLQGVNNSLTHVLKLLCSSPPYEIAAQYFPRNYICTLHYVLIFPKRRNYKQQRNRRVANPQRLLNLVHYPTVIRYANCLTHCGLMTPYSDIDLGQHGRMWWLVAWPSHHQCWLIITALHWRHNDHDSVSNHQPQCCLLNRLFRRRSKKTSKLRVTGLCVGNSPGPVNSPRKGPVTRKMFPFDDVIMWGLVAFMWGPFHRTSILGMCLKITNLRLKPHFTEASELMCSMWHYAQPGHHDLAPIWRQGISNHHGDVNQLVHDGIIMSYPWDCKVPLNQPWRTWLNVSCGSPKKR